MKKNSKKGKKDKKSYTTPEDSVEMAPELISTVTQLQSFIKKLPRCHTISSRLTATKNLLDIKNNELYQKCIELKGLSYLSNWLKEYKKSVASGIDLTRDEEFIVILPNTPEENAFLFAEFLLSLSYDYETHTYHHCSMSFPANLAGACATCNLSLIQPLQQAGGTV